jgi:long-chain fatty acid transport protein
MLKPLSLASLVLVSAVLAPSLSYASGFETARFGGEHGTPVSPNPTAIYYNPSALAETEGTMIWAEYDLAMRNASYTHSMAKTDSPEPAGAAGANNGKGTLFNVVGAPFLGASHKFGDLALGLAFYVPFGGSETWDQNSKFANNKMYPGIVDGPQRWYSITGSIISLYFSAGAAYKIPHTGLSVGVSGNLINTSINSLRARVLTGTDDITAEGRSWLNVSGWQGSFAAGALYEFLPKKLWMGASYQARPNVAGGMKLNGTLSAFSFGSETINKVSVYQDYPDIVRWGVRWRPSDRSEIRLFGDWERWSAFTDQCIANQDKPCATYDVAVPGHAKGSAKDGTMPIQNLPRLWQDGFGIRGGGSYWVSPAVELFGGAGYDSNAVPDAHLEPVIMDVKQITLAVGANFELNKHFGVGIAYTEFFGIPRDTSKTNENATFAAPSAGPNAGGQYTQLVGVINTNILVKF